MLKIKKWLKQFPLIVKWKRRLFDFYYAEDLRICNSLPAFAPYSSGSPPARAALTLQTATLTFPRLVHLLDTLGHAPLKVVRAADFATGPDDLIAAAQLKEAFNRQGSDKSTVHNYHLVYGKMLQRPKEITSMLEIGLGTNNPDVVSSMGRAGTPGASLRAFRDFLPLARVYGADVDKRILFEEERIKTFYVDQTDLSTLDQLAAAIPGELDLIIDDGLHSPDANIAVLSFALKKLKVGGWLAIEDIHPKAYPIWSIVATLLPADKYEWSMIEAEGALVFALRKLQ